MRIWLLLFLNATRLSSGVYLLKDKYNYKLYKNRKLIKKFDSKEQSLEWYKVNKDKF